MTAATMCPPARPALTRSFDLLVLHSFLGQGRFVPATRADTATTGHRDRQLVLVYARGDSTIRQHGHSVDIPAGSLCFLPNDASIDLRNGYGDHGAVVVVELPVEVSARARERVDSVLGRIISADSGAAALLRSFIDTLDQQLPVYSPDHPGWVQTCVCEITERVLAECATAKLTTAECAMQTAKNYIMTHLCDIDLDPSGVARQAAVSIRTLNRLFAAEGNSVGGWIRHQRLERCRDDLDDAAKSERGIAAIAAMWGFLDAAHFSRAFKDAFGCSPRAYRARQRAGDPTVDAPRALPRVHRVA